MEIDKQKDFSHIPNYRTHFSVMDLRPLSASPPFVFLVIAKLYFIFKLTFLFRQQFFCPVQFDEDARLPISCKQKNIFASGKDVFMKNTSIQLFVLFCMVGFQCDKNRVALVLSAAANLLILWYFWSFLYRPNTIAKYEVQYI